MPRIYSTRFLYGRGPNFQAFYYVPAGHRAVIRSVNLAFFPPGPGGLIVFIAGKPALYTDSPDSKGYRTVDCRLVAYAGEEVMASCSGPDSATHIAGFLFDDTGALAAESDPGRVDLAELEELHARLAAAR